MHQSGKITSSQRAGSRIRLRTCRPRTSRCAQIEFGGGTKIKMIESLAVGLPTVVLEETRLSANAQHGEHVWIVEKDEEHIYSGLTL